MASLSSGKREKNQIEWRRNKVQDLWVKGHNEYDMADALKVSQPTISRDIEYLRRRAQEYLKSHIQNKLPEEYQRCLTGMNQVLKLSWQIANNGDHNNENSLNNSNRTVIESDNKTRLQALALINDCYKYIMDLTTNGVVITDAIKFVQTSKEKLTMSNKEDTGKESKESDYDEVEDQLEEKQEEETGEVNQRETTNQVF